MKFSLQVLPHLLICVFLVACSGKVDRPSGPGTEWTSFGGSPGGGHFSPANEITPANVHALKVAWVHRSGDFRGPPAQGVGAINGPLQQTGFGVTAIVADDTLYYCTPYNRVFALDAANGKERWVFDPHVDVSQENVPVCRGVSLWVGEGASGPCSKRIFTGTLDARLIALDAANGAVCPDFGAGGTVDLNAGLTPHGSKEYSVTSPPAISGDTVIVGALVADSFRKGVPAGVVRAFDTRSGALKWAWNAVPPGQSDVNEDGTWRAGTPNVWSIISVDPQRNLIFLPTGNAGHDYFGGDRAGLDYYSTSVVALDGTTGKVVWHFQAVHHDVWDYDVPAQPTLIDLTIDGKNVPALVEVTKMGFTFVLNRETGEPLFPVEEKPAPQDGAVPEERLSATQPVPKLPEHLAKTRVTPEDAWGFTFWDKGKCRAALSAMQTGEVYQPPSLKGSIVNPSPFGGNDWGSPAIDPVSKRMIVTTTHVALSVRLVPRAQCDALSPDLPQTGSAYCAVVVPVLSPWGAPCTKPPWSTLDAVDLASGKIAWTRPLGELGRAARWPLSKMDGSAFSIGGPMITSTGLIFVGAGTDPALRAYDLGTGKELWKATLPTTANSVPMSYRLGDNGRQFVVVAAGGHFALSGMVPAGDYLMAFALPAE